MLGRRFETVVDYLMGVPSHCPQPASEAESHESIRFEVPPSLPVLLEPNGIASLRVDAVECAVDSARLISVGFHCQQPSSRRNAMCISA